jgi:hypothetical protein
MTGNSGNNARDNRQRGNAAQLLEKYKSMARDSQLAGDRVQTEYYLQFADHYFRVLGESRVRFDEQKRQRGDDDGDDDGQDDQMDNDAEAYGDGESDGDEQPEQRQQARVGNDRNDRPERTERDRPERAPRRDRPNGRGQASDRDERIDFAVLPPAIGGDDDGHSARVSTDDEEEAPVRRRSRRPRAAEGDGDNAS